MVCLYENTLEFVHWYLVYLRPPKPRYMFAWDVKQVLDFLKERFGDNDQMSRKELTLNII